MAELASSRARVADAEFAANNNVAAANVIAQMMNAGVARQDDDKSIIFDTPSGQHRVFPNVQQQQNQNDVANKMEDEDEQQDGNGDNE